MLELPSHTWRTLNATSYFEYDIEKIETATDRVLEETGLRFEGDPETLDIWRQFGGKVDGEHVRLDGPRLRSLIRQHAPSSFRLRARNPLRDTVIGQGHSTNFAPAYGAPNVRKADGTRLAGSKALYRELISLLHYSPAITNTGHMVCVMNDVPEAQRSMEMALAHMELSDKPFMGTIASPGDAERIIDAAALGVGRGQVIGECDLLHLINSTPPLTFKENPLKCLRTVARRRQGCMITSYMMMGATSPVSAAGALIQGYAEVLAGMALTQLWGPGTPMVMGLFAIPFSMRNMLPYFGDPVSHLISIYAVRLARHLGVPVRGDGGITSANIDDAQAGYEGSRATSFAASIGSDFILHAGGWLESGRCVSMAKLSREAASIWNQSCIGMPKTEPLPIPLDKALSTDLRKGHR